MTAKSSGGAAEEGMSDLTDRLRDHAALHEALTDEEQQQWGAELHEAADRIDALEAKNAELRAANKRAMFAMRDMEAALETERMRLVACGVVALADTPESAASARQMHDDYRSASLTDVIRRVDECIALRAALEKSRRSEHNPFETDNQSEHYERLCAALRAIEEVRK